MSSYAIVCPSNQFSRTASLLRFVLEIHFEGQFFSQPLSVSSWTTFSGYIARIVKFSFLHLLELIQSNHLIKLP
ncbi:MAG: hypothetical protein ACXVNF_13940, partial [Neobacillus sp.]